MIEVIYIARIRITPEDIEAGEDDVAQAVQNVTGGTGNKVERVIETFPVAS